MRDDIGKKFIDILFETDDSDDVDTIADAPLEDVRFSGGKKTNETPATANAKEYLYSKDKQSETITKRRSSFISMDEAKHIRKAEDPSSAKAGDGSGYTLTANLSPMFGLLDKKNDADLNTNMAPVRTNNYESYLGTIISPIYGTDVKNDFTATNNLSVYKIEKNYEPFIIEEEPEEKPDLNDTLSDSDNLFINEEIEEEFEKAEEHFVDQSEDIDENIYRQVLNEERGFSNTQEIDLFEDLFKEDRD